MLTGRSYVTPDASELAADVGQRLPEAGAVRRVVQPAARAGRMRQGDRDRVVEKEALADRLGEPAARRAAGAQRPARR